MPGARVTHIFRQKQEQGRPKMAKNDKQMQKFKTYEQRYSTVLPKTRHIVIRLDGKAFHTYTRSFNKPFDPRIEKAFQETTKYLCEQIQSVQIAYSQSDEITLICGVKESGEHWFNGKVQKITSTSASLATAKFNQVMAQLRPDFGQFAIFDSRVFVVPEEDLIDVLVWRQRDAIRNSISALAQSHFSHKSLQGKSKTDQLEMLQAVEPWETLTVSQQRGFIVKKETIMRYTEYLDKEVERKVWQISDAPMFDEQRHMMTEVLL